MWDFTLMLLIICCIFISCLLMYLLKDKNKKQLHKIVILLLSLLVFWYLGIISQIVFAEKYSIPPVYFEYFVYISACFVPVVLYFMAIIFVNTTIKFKKSYVFLFIIPIVTLLVLWTNDYHHLFFKVYSTKMREIITGPMHTINAIYTYLLLFWSVYTLIKYSIKNAGFFSKQVILIVIGSIIPIITNLLGTIGMIDMNVYVTPITFGIAISLYVFAMFKFDFLGTTPIALQRIVDRISDSYIVLNEKVVITDYNKTFLDTFNLKDTNIRGKNLIEFIRLKEFDFNVKKLESSIEKAQTSTKTISFEQEIKKINKIFMVEVSTIMSNNTFLGIVILLKDITQHKQDMQQIKDSQEQLMEKERLSSLGQLVGGIAHNLKTPIMSISGAAEGISDLAKEYDSSIEDPEVTPQDHHEIAGEMLEWVSKIKTHTEYMSDVITAVKGQAVALSEDTVMTFTIDELIKRVNILMKHELKNAIIYLNIDMKKDSNVELKGDVNSLVQVINNMISNAIQAYDGKPEQTIDLIAKREKNNVIISVKDYASGLPAGVKDKLFKEMITTKGKNGTGLGLYMSYSNIRAHFNGNITVESEQGKGTIFNIILPI